MKTLLVVAAALINEQGEVLLAQRPAGKQLAGYFEFPGGKVEAGEAPEQALIRELKEELGIDVQSGDLTVLTFLSHPYQEYDFHLLMPVWTCRTWQGEVQALEHSSLQWVHPDDMKNIKMIEADQPLVKHLQSVIPESGFTHECNEWDWKTEISGIQSDNTDSSLDPGSNKS